MKHALSALTMGAVIVGLGGLCLGETVDNPAYGSWAKFKPETMIQMKVTADFGGNKTVQTMTTTLKEVTAEKVVLEVKVSMETGGQKIDMPPQTQEIPAKIEKQEPPADAPKPKVSEGTEKVTVPAGEFDCKKTTTEMEVQGTKTVSTAWTCDSVPGMLVKTESKMAQGSSTSELVKMDVKE